MEFSQFFQIFYGVCRCGTNSKAQFLERVLSQGLISSKKKDELSRISRKQKEELISGAANPYSFCKRFADSFSIDAFKAWLEEIGEGDEECIHDDLVDRFCAQFRPYLCDITPDNCIETIANTLACILEEGAKTAIQNSCKRQRAKRLATFNEQSGRCYLCQRPICAKESEENSLTLFELDEKDGKKTVGLCPSCLKKAEQNGKILFIHEKPRFQFCDEMIEERLVKALERLEKLDDDELEPQLNYAGLKISKKIDKKKHPAFYRKLSDNVARYYPIMQRTFSDYDGENGNSFERLSCKMRDLFLQIKSKENDPAFVFDAIVDEVEKKAKTDRLTSELIVSFFVQNCEVFDEIPE